jgi:hypothetical protein
MRVEWRREMTFPTRILSFGRKSGIRNSSWVRDRFRGECRNAWYNPLWGNSNRKEAIYGSDDGSSGGS